MAAPSRLVGNELIGAVTLAVSPTGSDTDVTRPKRIIRGDWSAKPFATIQAAIDSLPPVFSSDNYATIGIAPGSYASFMVASKSFGYGGMWIEASGDIYADYTPSTGPASGTLTGVLNNRVTVSGAGWTVGELSCRAVDVAGTVYQILDNTSDTLILNVNTVPAAPGAAFTLKDFTVNIDSVDFYNCTGWTGLQGVKTGYVTVEDVSGFYLQDFGSGGIQIQHTGVVYLTRVVNTSGSLSLKYVENVNLQNNVGFIGLAELMYCSWIDGGTADTTSLGQLWVESCKKVYLYKVRSSPSVGILTGIYIISSELDLVGLTLDAFDTAIIAYRSKVTIGSGAGTNTISNSGTKTFILSESVLRLDEVLAGSNPLVAWGISARGANNLVVLSATPTITGTSGNATVDDLNALVWATDLAASGDYAHDIASGARIYRS